MYLQCPILGQLNYVPVLVVIIGSWLRLRLITNIGYFGEIPVNVEQIFKDLTDAIISMSISFYFDSCKCILDNLYSLQF